MKCFKEVAVLLLCFIFKLVSSQRSQSGNITSSSLIPKPSDGNITAYCDGNLSCPTWFNCDVQKVCKCGNGHNNAVVCDDKSLVSAVLDCNCVTYDGETEATFLGACFYNCGRHFPNLIPYNIYQKLPTSPKTLLNKSVCTNFHRTGLLCGDCKEGHSPFVFSYNLSCVKCPEAIKTGGISSWLPLYL